MILPLRSMYSIACLFTTFVATELYVLFMTTVMQCCYLSYLAVTNSFKRLSQNHGTHVGIKWFDDFICVQERLKICQIY